MSDSFKVYASQEYVENKIGTKVDKTITINGKALSDNIALTAADVGAATESYVDNALSEFGGTPIITDTATGKHYELYVENGKLTMKETGVIGGKAIFKDVATGASYELYVENGTLSMKEAE
jgi:phenolic acid decarboxylase